ncbi:amidase family protein [Zunongwangia endophytica]|uniref:Amidase family protein n=1 Tax=Zunongwangia endophytica TaxID=1808945 RepID=A0ABV8HBZ4_9FLAO|nr:amidase family protein [Zunongwangia endophytica]MDN3593419.1 amidase family protein [Zunongwangia endophytica]
MKKVLFLFISLAFISCGKDKKNNKNTEEILVSDSTGTSDYQGDVMLQFKVLDSKYLENKVMWSPFEIELYKVTEKKYDSLKRIILEKDITQLQNSIAQDSLTYEELTLFYLYRMRKLDRENELSLNSVIALNPDVLTEARLKDRNYKNTKDKSPIYGIPVLLKDNINTATMATTAGAVALQGNTTPDAFITTQLVNDGALILGKANLSEWAYYFCEDCPSGYSAVGGQTLNPYGRRIFDTGGSSSGSAVAVAANFAPISVGSETSGSILSPASQNSLVGLKPTVGLLSRRGIIPISSTLDTPGPITKTVRDNAVLLSAMAGRDTLDSKVYADSIEIKKDYYSALTDTTSLKGSRFGAIKELMKDSLYSRAVDELKKAGAKIVIFDAKDVDLPDFKRLLNLDMKKDLSAYLERYAKRVDVKSIEEIVNFNIEDSVQRIPYGQALLESVVKDSASTEKFQAIKDTLKTRGREFFNTPMENHRLDGILSINNYHAGFAAVAEYPAITVPMGYDKYGEPKGLTFISIPYSEQNLLRWAYAYEKQSKERKPPKDYIK